MSFKRISNLCIRQPYRQFSQYPQKDPSHPSLFYHLFTSPSLAHHSPLLPHSSPSHHLLQSGPIFALSFIQSRPASLQSQTILGWLPALTRNGQEATLDDFVQNERFVNLLHKTLKRTIPNDTFWKNSALIHQDGWMHIYDHRSPPPPSRIPDPSDILATVLISSSTIQPESYQPMPTYRLVTSDGACLLSDDAMREVCQEAEQVAKSEWDEVGGEDQS